ncbi:hypothetical protein ACHABQ_02885 [Nesterenkonia aurantiaca]|uniref:hypothetical protein n=1 Tax=Nesterenkonia aurantiaca TaxID=1436010 RepID=UPI003EE64ED5
MAWSYVLCETRTGRKLTTVTPISSGSWGRRLAYKGTGSHDFLLSENPAFGGTFTGPNRMLVVCWEGEPWYAGILWKRRYDDATGVVTVSHADIWSIWERRLAGPEYQSVTMGRRIIETRISYSGSLRTHMKRAIELGMRGPELLRPDYQLPVVLPEDATGDQQITYWTYDFLTVAEALSNIMERGINITVDFPVRWNAAGNLEWTMRMVPQAVDSEMFLRVGTKKTEVTELSLSEDYENFATEVHVTGEGSETGSLHRRRWNNSESNDRVALFHHEAMSEIKDAVELAERNDAEYWARRSTPQQIECTVQVGREYDPIMFRLGRTITLRVFKGGSILTPGTYRRQLIGVMPAGPDAVKLELIPL